eukprot:2359462-Prorocentrum_lima.AAC.1
MQRRPGRRIKPGASRGPLPTVFGDSCTIDHWYALDDLSRGIDGESYGLTFYDRATGWIECIG